jgi:hypothetical protein
MIVSDAYCHSKYAQKSQSYFLKNSKILKLDFLSKIKVFEAGVHNIVYFFQKSEGSKNTPERRVHESEFGTITILPTNEQKSLDYRVFFPEDGESKEFSISTVLLSDICYISVGMVANANEKLAKGLFKLKDLLSDRQDQEHPKPFVEGKNLDRWILIQDKYIEWGTDRSPALLRRPTFIELYEQETKLMLPMVGEIRAALDTNRLYCNHGIFVGLLWYYLKGVKNKSIKKFARYGHENPKRPDLPIREDLEKLSLNFSNLYVLGILNSKVAQHFLKANRRNNIQLYPDDWKKLPIPDITLEQQQPIIKLVNKILEKKRQNPKADTSNLEREIDKIVYQLYGLSEEEIAIIEETNQRK